MTDDAIPQNDVPRQPDDETPADQLRGTGSTENLPNPENPPGYEWYQALADKGANQDESGSGSAASMEESPTVLLPDEKPAPVPAIDQSTPVISAPPGINDALPVHVDLVDLSATVVAPAAAFAQTTPAVSPAGDPARPAVPAMHDTQPTLPARPLTQKPIYVQPRNTNGSRKPRRKVNRSGCLVKSLVIGLFAAVIIALIAGVILVSQYFRIAATLPSVADIKQRASQFETTRFYDRNGQLLYEMIDPNAGRRTYVPLSKISPYLVAATIAIEDKEYYNHPGFDIFALVRALVQNYTSGEVVSGASTITQQLARMLFFTPEERVEISYRRKAREIILSAEMTRRYSKDEILELYLNEINYGNLAYGIEAAADTYFNTTAEKLDLAQSAFLAGLPQAPSVYDIFTNRDATLNRNKQVLTAMYNVGREKNCIRVSNSSQPICVEAQQAADAFIAIDSYNFVQKANPMVYPHWVNYIRYLLETKYDPQTIYRSGFRVYTTLDPKLQQQADHIVKEQVNSLAEKHVTDGALVSIQPQTGEILAMTGSADFYNDAIAGQINMALQPRQPGSSIKPLTYAAAFEKGWTPATIVWDVPSEFPPSGDPNDPSAPYVPANYDGEFHGPQSVRSALANSYNIPAVKALQYVGIYDDPNTNGEDGMLAFTRRMGITTLTRNDYGLSLTLGGGEVTLLEMTSAYGVFANNGKRVEPYAITKITDYQGNVIFEAESPRADQMITPQYAYLITSILSDKAARAPMFGTDSILNLDFPSAAKTGTTNNYKDNWTIGYTPNLVTGVWVGNADNSSMENVSGIAGAAPIWHQFMAEAVPYLTNNTPADFAMPDGIVQKTVCVYSGSEPSDYCPKTRTEIFSADRLPPTAEDDLWKKVTIDTWTNLRASSECNEYTSEELTLNVTDKWAVKWLKESGDGQEWLEKVGFPEPVIFTPARECRSDDPHPTLQFVGLENGQIIKENPLDIYAVIDATGNYRNFTLDFGKGKDPGNWMRLDKNSVDPAPRAQKIFTWEMSDMERGFITLRLLMKSSNGGYAEKKIVLELRLPTPTPTPTKRPTSTPTPTPTEPIITETVPPYETPTPQPTETPPEPFGPTP